RLTSGTRREHLEISVAEVLEDQRARNLIDEVVPHRKIVLKTVGVKVSPKGSKSHLIDISNGIVCKEKVRTPEGDRINRRRKRFVRRGIPVAGFEAVVIGRAFGEGT